MIGEPPSSSGTFQSTVAAPPVPDAVTPSGSDGRPAGTTALEDKDDEEFPAVLVAVAVKVYGSPLVNGVIVQRIAGEKI